MFNHNNSLIFGTKIQIYNFVIFTENWIFGHKLRFSYSVLCTVVVNDDDHGQIDTNHKSQKIL